MYYLLKHNTCDKQEELPVKFCYVFLKSQTWALKSNFKKTKRAG